ncbi:MAG: hypothetical protein NVSMB57_11050 [Actinomycetota bacterium]
MLMTVDEHSIGAPPAVATPATTLPSHRRFGLFRDLSLFSKLMVPFFTLILLLGIVGGFVTVHDLSTRAESAVDQALLIRSLDARSFLRDRELYLLEAVNFASNVQGIALATKEHDGARVKTLLNAVRSLKSDLQMLFVVDASGKLLAQSVGPAGNELATHVWSGDVAIREALTDTTGKRFPSILSLPSGNYFIIAAPVCSKIVGCAPVGVSVVGISAPALASRLIQEAPRAASVTLWDRQNTVIGSAGNLVSPPAARESSETQRRFFGSGSGRRATAYEPLVFGSKRLGTVGVTIATSTQFAAAGKAAKNLALVLLVALFGIVLLGAVLSRRILAQVRPLVETNRALGRGELTARAPVLGRDELGELAAGVNQMADQLQASVETLELRVEQRTNEIQHLLEERTEFFASLSHEFRTPLAVILTQAKLFETAKKLSPQQSARSWEIVKGSATELLCVVNDILDLARAETGHVEMTLQRLDAGDLLAEMTPMLRALGESAGIAVKVRAPRGLAQAYADPGRLREVILNLVDNAVKYSPAGKEVEITLTESEQTIDIVIKDQGIGIPSELIEKIFAPFYRVKSSRTQQAQPSTGLGLPIAKRLIEAQGGSIQVESVRGSGSTFTLSVPKASG